MSLLFALRHPDAVNGLILWRVTGGQFAANRLAENYYGQFIAAAQQGGMAKVCETEHFKERIQADPANRERLMAVTPERFIAVMSRWRQYFLDGANLPVIGVSASELASIGVPTLVVPGNDNTHPRVVGENAARLMPASELRILLPDHIDVDVASEAWDEKESELVELFTSFLDRVTAPAPV